MCTSPLTIYKPNDGFDCHQLKRYWRDKVFENLYAYNCFTVPCGKCAQCLRARQNDLAARCVRCAQQYGSMQFLTLTYSNINLPISSRLEFVDTTTGEITHPVVLRQEVRSLDDSAEEFFLDDVRYHLLQQDKSSCKYVYRELPSFDGSSLIRVVYTFSLNPRDVRLWIKNCRVKYKRLYGVDLPDWKYVICGELGPRTKRPHYHCAFFGLSREQAQFFADEWSFGFTCLKSVNAVNSDGSSGFELASRYIGKYMSKGRFEEESIRNGYSYKPRLLCSKNLGSDLPDSWVSYFRCYDLIGEYDISKPLDISRLSILKAELPKRFTFLVGSKSFCLPNVIIKKLWYVKNSNGGFSSSVVRKQVTDALRSDAFSDVLSSMPPALSEDAKRAYFKYALSEQARETLNLRVKNEHGMFALLQFYTKSKF